MALVLVPSPDSFLLIRRSDREGAVRPYVFIAPSRAPIALNSEVSEAEWVAVDHLLHTGTYRPVSLELRGEIREFPAYHLENSLVWGMTERILTDLVEEFRRSES